MDMVTFILFVFVVFVVRRVVKWWKGLPNKGEVIDTAFRVGRIARTLTR